MNSKLSLSSRFGLFLLLGINLFIGFGIRAQAAYTKQNSRVVRFQAEVTTVAGNVTSVKCDAFLVSSFVNTTDATDIVDAPRWSAVQFDLLDPTLAAVNITAAGKTVTYPQLAALMRQASLDRATAQGITKLLSKSKVEQYASSDTHYDQRYPVAWAHLSPMSLGVGGLVYSERYSAKQAEPFHVGASLLQLSR